jgi:corrinoid protein of di/trimethylamine methyltransferase
MTAELYQSMAQSIFNGDEDLAAQLARQAVQDGLDPLAAINQGFVIGLEQVGQQFNCGEAFIPDLVMAGEAMKAALAVLEPELARRGTARQTLGRVVIATIQGDIHDIGKTLVGTMLSASGFEVFDLGVNVPIPAIIEKARAVQADIVGLSALLTTTMVNQRVAIQELDKAGLRPPLKVMVGGAPVTRGWAAEIGADGYSEDAIGAVAVAKQLLSA